MTEAPLQQRVGMLYEYCGVCPFINLFNKYLLSTFYGARTILGIRDTTVHPKIAKAPTYMEFIF